MPDEPEMTAKERQTTAVQALFLQHQPMIRSYVLSMIPDFSLADDVVQETFLVVSRKAMDFDLETSFPAWVKTIARFKTLETIRRHKGRLVFFSDEVLDSLGTEPLDLGEPEVIDSRLELLNCCIEELAPQARKSIECRYLRDLLPPQIAALMGCTVQSTSVTLSRARAFLRECVRRKMNLRVS